jgi:hypothetical protein
VVQGGLTTGLLHALVAMDLPGPGTVFMNQEWKFTAPVFIDDTITAEAEVLSVHATKPVTTLGITVRFRAYPGAFSEIDIVVRPIARTGEDQITALAVGRPTGSVGTSPPGAESCSTSRPAP